MLGDEAQLREWRRPTRCQKVPGATWTDRYLCHGCAPDQSTKRGISWPPPTLSCCPTRHLQGWLNGVQRKDHHVGHLGRWKADRSQDRFEFRTHPPRTNLLL